jgi:demethylmenaquinone methyltransferase/2-methoxy-6-polyprenyl-1,4-benzoquinol methylase
LIEVLYFNREQHSPRTALLSLIPDTPVRVLDVCAGTGSNSLAIAEKKPEAKITVLDLSADMLKIADKKFRKASISNVEPIIADAGNTCFDGNMFDVILLSLVLHEIKEDLRQAILSEAKRILNSNGRIIIIEWEQPQKFFQRFMFSLIKQTELEGFKNFLHIDLAAYFHTLGLTVLEKHSCDYTQVFVLSKQ